jgi:hypothetical protein
MSHSRAALLGMYAAVDEDFKRDLRYVKVTFPEPLDPYAQLRMAAEEQPDEDSRPSIHQLHLALAAMSLLRRPAPPSDAPEQLRPVAARLLHPEAPGSSDEEAVDAVVAALQAAAGTEVADEERWTRFVREVAQQGLQLHPELAIIQQAWCGSQLRQVGDEFASRIETRLVVRGQRTLDELASALLPHNWRRCNDFFCDLIRVPERDRDCLATTGGTLSSSLGHWRGVYEERVGGCPDGWFPDTYLLFTWDRSERQLILRYELAPRRGSDRTVLKIDQGYIQVDRLPDTYQVATVKYLLFDDTRIPGGGQSLARMACQLGWLDYSVNQFTDCAKRLPGMSTTTAPVSSAPAGIDAELQQVLDRCQVHLQEMASDSDAQFGAVMAKIRKGSYSLDDCVRDWARLMARAIRDGSRSLEDQIDFARRSVDLARAFARGRGGANS